MKLAILAGPAFILAVGLALAETPGKGAHFIENWDGDGDGAVTLEEARTMRGNVFYMFDADENQILDPSEYDLFDETRAAELAINADQQELTGPVHGLRREFSDTDGDGSVSLNEFLNSTDSWFTKFDMDGNGQITSADFGG